MYNVQLDSDMYFTGTYATIGKVENGFNVESLPPMNDIDGGLAYKLVQTHSEETILEPLYVYYYINMVNKTVTEEIEDPETHEIHTEEQIVPTEERVYITEDELSEHPNYRVEHKVDDAGNIVYENRVVDHIKSTWELDETKLNSINSSNVKNIIVSKQKELGEICTETITNGFDIVLSDGLNHHFSLETKDQTAILMLYQQAVADANSITFWHADGEICKQFSNPDMIAIGKRAIEFKTYNETLINHLNRYMESLTNIENIEAVVYSIDSLSEEYKNSFMTILTSLQ